MKPRETVVIFVGKENILVQGVAVALVADILENKAAATDPIISRLEEIRLNVVGPATLAAAGSQEVTRRAVKSGPCAVSKRIMSTCTDGGYENVSLAVIQKESQVSPG